MRQKEDYLLNKDKNNQRFYGLDYLRFIFCIDIVIWHTVGYGYIPDPTLRYIFIYYFGLLGVPIFFQISLFLFAFKTINTDEKKEYFINRMKVLLLIYIFWMPLNYILVYDDFYEFFTDPKRFAYFLIGNFTPMYFIPILIILTISTYFFIRLGDILLEYGSLYPLIIFVLLICSLILMQFGRKIMIDLDFPLGYANPFNFFPYIFTSILIVLIYKHFIQNQNENKPNENRLLYLIISLLIITIIIALIEKAAFEQDWSVLNYNYRTYVYFNYARISLVTLSTFISIISLYIIKTPHKIVLVISELSLGIYVIHNIVIHYTYLFIEGMEFKIHRLILPLIVLIISIGIISMLKHKTDKIL